MTRALATVAVGFAAVMTLTSTTTIAAQVQPNAPGPGLATDADDNCVGWGKPAEERLKLVNQAIVDGFNTRNVDALMRFVTADVSYVSRAGEYKTGRENMRADFVTIFANLPAGTTIEKTVINVTSLAPGMAHSDVRAAVTYLNPDGTVARVQKFMSSNVWQLGCVPQAKVLRDYTIA